MTRRRDVKRGLIQSLVGEGLTAKQVWASLPEPRPTLRHVYRVVSEVSPWDPSGTWTLANADGDDVALVAPVLAAVVERSQGRRRQLTNREALLVGKIRRAIPKFEGLFYIYMLAREYIYAEAQERSTEYVDLLIAGLAKWGNSLPWDYFEMVGADQLLEIWRLSEQPYADGLEQEDDSETR